MENDPFRYDLEALDRYLMSDRAAEDSMSVSDMDGLLTCVAIGPELIPPSEWFPMILGQDAPDFESDDEMRLVIGTIMGRYNEIVRCFETDPTAFVPIFWESPHGTTIVTDWAAGFLDGLALRPKLWEKLINHRQHFAAIGPIMILGDEEGELDDEVDIAKLAADGPELIPLCLAAIYEFWRARRTGAKPPRKAKHKSRHRRSGEGRPH